MAHATGEVLVHVHIQATIGVVCSSDFLGVVLQVDQCLPFYLVFFCLALSRSHAKLNPSITSIFL